VVESQEEGSYRDDAEGRSGSVAKGGLEVSATIQKRGESYRIAIHRGGGRKYVTVKTKKEADAVVAQVRKLELTGINVVERVEQARTMTPANPHPLLKDALPAWIESQIAAGDIRHSTGRVYLDRSKTWLYPTVGDVHVDQITREQIGRVIRQIKEAGRSMGTVKQCLNPLKTYFADQVERKILTVNPASDLRYFIGKRQSKGKKKVKVFTLAERGRVLQTAYTWFPRWGAFIETAYKGGLRWGEIAALQPADIDFDREEITVRRTVSEGGRIERPKNDIERTVLASPDLLKALRLQIEATSHEAATHGWTDCPWVFPNLRGKLRSYSGTVTQWQKIQAKATVSYLNFHCTRHTFASTLLEGKADIRWVQNQLGHASISQTVDTYGHLVPEAHAHNVKILDRSAHNIHHKGVAV
jgi:integrase